MLARLLSKVIHFSKLLLERKFRKMLLLEGWIKQILKCKLNVMFLTLNSMLFINENKLLFKLILNAVS